MVTAVLERTDNQYVSQCFKKVINAVSLKEDESFFGLINAPVRMV